MSKKVLSDLDFGAVARDVNNAPWVEVEEIGAGPHTDYPVTLPEHILASNAAGAFTGIASSKVGDLAVVSHQGSGYTEFLHNTVSAFANRFFNSDIGGNIRILDNEAALFVSITGVEGGVGSAASRKWLPLSHHVPFCNLASNAAGDALCHNGTKWTIVAGANNANQVLRGNATFGTVSIAALAPLGDGVIMGRARGAGTGPVTPLTGAQALDALALESPNWQGATFATATSGDVQIGSTAGGVALNAGHANAGIGNDSIAINSKGGIVIRSDATTPNTTPTAGQIRVEAPGDMWMSTTTGGIALNATGAHTTGVTNGVVEIAASGELRVSTGGVSRLDYLAAGAWRIGGSTGTPGHVPVCAGSAAPPVWGVISPVALGSIVDNMAIPFVFRVAYTPGTPGTPDDVMISSGLPPGFDARITDIQLMTSTAIAGSTGTLRSATGGLGVALSAAIPTSALGSVRDVTRQGSNLISAGTPLYWRRSDRGVGGELLVYATR